MQPSKVLLAAALALVSSQPYAFDFKMATSKSTSALSASVRPPQAGSAYNSFDDTILPVQCLNGNLSQISYNESTSIDFVHTAAYDSIKKDTEISGEVDYKGYFNANNFFRFVTNLKETRTRSTMVFRYQTKGQYQLFNASYQNGSILNDLGLSALRSDASMGQFFRTCGDKVVDHLTTGGNLYVALSINFATDFMKQHFESKGKADFTTAVGVFDLKSGIQRVKTTYGESATILLSAYQVGGDSTYVGDLLALVTGEKIANCTKVDSSVGECSQVIDSLHTYVSGPLALSMKNHPTVLGFGSSSYAFVPEIGNHTFAIYPASVIDARKRLTQVMVQQNEIRSEWDSAVTAYNSFPPMLKGRWQDTIAQVTAAISVLDSNLLNLRAAFDTCYNSSAETVNSLCEASVNNVLLNLSTPQFPPKPFAVYDHGLHNVNGRNPEIQCKLPELSVLTGVAMRTKGTNAEGILCWYRPLNANGTLGAETSMQVGSGSEAAVRVPAGHVMTGYGYRVKDDNTKTAIAYYRKWDPVTRSLTGPTLSVRGGSDPNNGLELVYNLAGGTANNKPIDTNHMILTGIGAAVKGDNADGLRAFLGWIE